MISFFYSNSYLGAGYHKMCNADHTWAVSHYLFRGQEDKAILGTRSRDTNDECDW